MVIYRTDGSWGSGKGANLTPAEVDTNFNELDTRITDLEENPVAAPYLSSFEMRDVNQLYGIMSDSTEIGPITIPIALWTYKGEWLPNYPYKIFDTFSSDLGLYIVRRQHTSKNGEFDPNDNDGAGNDYYYQLLAAPQSARWRGEWEPVEEYEYLDWVKVSTPLEYSGIYQVTIGHTSDVAFDPDIATLPSGGTLYYQKLMDFPLKRIEIAPYFFLPHTDGAIMYQFITTRKFILEAGLLSSKAKATAAASGTATWEITKNGSVIGEILFDGSDIGTFIFPHDIVLDENDVLGFTAPSPADVGLGNVALNIVGVYI